VIAGNPKLIVVRFYAEALYFLIPGSGPGQAPAFSRREKEFSGFFDTLLKGEGIKYFYDTFILIREARAFFRLDALRWIRFA